MGKAFGNIRSTGAEMQRRRTGWTSHNKTYARMAAGQKEMLGRRTLESEGCKQCSVAPLDFVNKGPTGSAWVFPGNPCAESCPERGV